VVYLLRESRHLGVALGLDSLKLTSIDSDVRNVTDFMILKAQGLFGLPRDLRWLYSIINPFVIQNMKPHQFILLSRTGALATGEFEEVSWHKREKEDTLGLLGIEVEHGDPIQEGQDRGTFKTIGDEQHSNIIASYINGEGGMGILAKKYDVSSATIHSHIHAHNNELVSEGVCSMCERVSSEYSHREANRT